MEKTAVEWLMEGFSMQTSLYTKNELIEIAKEMEKKQIILAFYEGQKFSDNKIEVFAFGENYYKEKFKSEKNGK